MSLNQSAIEVLLRRQGGDSTRGFTYESNTIVQVNTKSWSMRFNKHEFKISGGMIFGTPLLLVVVRRSGLNRQHDQRKDMWEL